MRWTPERPFLGQAAFNLTIHITAGEPVVIQLWPAEQTLPCLGRGLVLEEEELKCDTFLTMFDFIRMKFIAVEKLVKEESVMNSSR
ncbi:hypothetical protein HOY80DRAFT_1063494 [Tuber brumale]|nr:hypothetical protein HOY80DRAFT_1063494 [Tuber brumale]